MSDVTEKTVVKELMVPFDENDEAREELIQQIIESRREIARLEEKMSPLKQQQKSVKEKLEEAEYELSTGRIGLVPCSEMIYWAENRVAITRLDTGELVQTREIEDADYQQRAEL